MDLKYAFATMHATAQNVHPTFTYLESDDYEGDEITFKIMSDGGKQDLKIAIELSKWLTSRSISHRRNGRVFQIHGQFLQNLIDLGKGGLASPKLVEKYTEHGPVVID